MKKGYRILFNFFSILFLSSLVIFYGYRLGYYYILEHQDYENKQVHFYEKLINSKGIEGTDKGLQKSDDGYVFVSKSSDNYVYYVGRLWRIISIDKNNNIKMITDEPQTLLNWNNTVNFTDSNINKWLNKNDSDFSGVFELSLKDESNNIIKQNSLVASLLTKNEYEAIGENNYLTGEPFWIINEDKPSYIDAGGNIVTPDDSFDIYGVRPTIVLSSEFMYETGTGTEADPYILKKNIAETLSNVYVGEYVNYNNYLWRVIEVSDAGVKIALEDTLNLTEPIFFSAYDNVYCDYEGVGLYLNNDFYNSLSNNDYIVQNNFYSGDYSVNNNYDYSNTRNLSVFVNVGLYSVGEFFINTISNTYTLTPYANSTSTIYTINNNKKLYADFITNTYDVRPTLYLDGNLFVIDGDGTKNKPYEVGR